MSTIIVPKIIPPRLLTRLCVLLVASVALISAPGTQPHAQGYPDRPVTLIVGSAAGSAPDSMARMLADGLRRELGQPIIIDNRPGAGTMIGAEAAARARPDGHTLLLTTVANTINQALRPRPGAHIVENFDHVSLLGFGASILVVPSSSSIKTLADLRDTAKASPGKLVYGSGGIGTSGHLAMELLQLRAGIKLTHVPYKAGPQSVLDLLGGDLDVVFTNFDVALPHIKSGRLRALGVTTRERNPQLPELPTIAEQGLTGFEVTTWGGISVPAGTPPERIRILDEAIRRAAEGEFREKQEAGGLLVRPMQSEAFAHFVREETAKWQEVVEKAGVKLD